jgi:altronate hydrolase
MTRVINMIVLGGNDNVGVALRDIAPGEMALDAKDREIIAREAIPQAHKIAITTIAGGEPIIRMDVAVGIAREPIAEGSLAHVHNIRSQYLDNAEDHYE